MIFLLYYFSMCPYVLYYMFMVFFLFQWFYHWFFLLYFIEFLCLITYWQLFALIFINHLWSFRKSLIHYSHLSNHWYFVDLFLQYLRCDRFIILKIRKIMLQIKIFWYFYLQLFLIEFCLCVWVPLWIAFIKFIFVYVLQLLKAVVRPSNLVHFQNELHGYIVGLLNFSIRWVSLIDFLR